MTVPTRASAASSSASPGPACADAMALLLADARLPVGGHARSGGLEPALAAGLSDIPGYLGLRLRTVVRTEAATAVVTRSVLLRGGCPGAVVDAWAARTPSRALREEARTVGRALERLGRRLWAPPALPPGAPGPVVLGALAVAVGLGPAALARVVAYDDVQTVVSAALKLRPLDPAVATGWVVDSLPAMEAVVDATAHLDAADQIPARSAPAIEQYAESHARTTRRLFRA